MIPTILTNASDSSALWKATPAAKAGTAKPGETGLFQTSTPAGDSVSVSPLSKALTGPAADLFALLGKKGRAVLEGLVSSGAMSAKDVAAGLTEIAKSAAASSDQKAVLTGAPINDQSAIQSGDVADASSGTDKYEKMYQSVQDEYQAVWTARRKNIDKIHEDYSKYNDAAFKNIDSILYEYEDKNTAIRSEIRKKSIGGADGNGGGESITVKSYDDMDDTEKALRSALDATTKEQNDKVQGVFDEMKEKTKEYDESMSEQLKIEKEEREFYEEKLAAAQEARASAMNGASSGYPNASDAAAAAAASAARDRRAVKNKLVTLFANASSGEEGDDALTAATKQYTAAVTGTGPSLDTLKAQAAEAERASAAAPPVSTAATPGQTAATLLNAAQNTPVAAAKATAAKASAAEDTTLSTLLDALKSGTATGSPNLSIDA